MTIVYRTRGKIIRTDLCCVVHDSWFKFPVGLLLCVLFLLFVPVVFAFMLLGLVYSAVSREPG